MKYFNRIRLALKSLRQLNTIQIALFGLYRVGCTSGYYRHVLANKTGKAKFTAYHARLFQLPSRELLQETLGEHGSAALIKEAVEIAAGKARQFGSEPAPIHLGFSKSIEHWSVYEKHPERLFDLTAPISDIKLVWEPARFGWAFVLGRAFHITQDEQYAETFWRYFEAFSEANPPYLGPQWMNGQEVAIRFMALLWASQMFQSARASSTSRKEQLTESLLAHAARIPPTLIYARSQNNNHLITEAAALYSAGVVFGNKKWKKIGRRWLNWAFQHQISDYGEYIQHSTNYHRLMLQAALWMTSIMKGENKAWPLATSQALARAAHWLFSMVDSTTGRTPNLGANDGALLFQLGNSAFDDYRPTVQAAARAFLDTQIQSGDWDEMSLWFGFPPAKKTYQSGDYLTDNLRGRESWGYLRSTRFKSRLGHMDQLHLDLWWRGINIAQDAGSYQYNAQPPWDNPFIGTRFHNTISVDGRDQMTRGGRFLTLDWFPAYSRTMIDPRDNVLRKAMAYHRGYKDVLHERTVTVFVDEHWRVEDKLSSHSAHIYRLHWLLPDWEWKVESRTKEMANGKGRTEISIKSSYGWIKLLITANLPVQNTSCSISIARAGEIVYGEQEASLTDGWVSPTYGIKQPALSLAVLSPAIESMQFTTEFIFPA